MKGGMCRGVLLQRIPRVNVSIVQGERGLSLSLERGLAATTTRFM